VTGGAVTVHRAPSGAGGEIGWESQGEGPDLVLLHGSLTDRSAWAPLVPHLAGRFRVAAVDRRGRGLSASAPGPGVLETEVQDLAAVAGALSAPPLVCGWSYGAVVALEAALAGVPVSGLVLYEPPLSIAGPVVPPGLVERFGSLVAAGDPEAAVEAFMAVALELPPPFVELVRQTPTWPVAVATAATATADMAALRDHRYDPERMARCAAPALVLSGSQSPDRLRSAAERLAADLPAGRLHVLADQHHFAFMVDPAGFAAVIEGFA